MNIHPHNSDDSEIPEGFNEVKFTPNEKQLAKAQKAAAESQVESTQIPSANSVPKPEYERVTGNEQPPEPVLEIGYDFADPVELLYFLDDTLQRGRKNGGVDLYPWQIQIMKDFAKGGKDHENPFQALVRACNGSGKDKYVIASCSVWLSLKYLRVQNVVTSASGSQLDTQTCRHIRYLCEQCNRKIHPRVWKINYRHFTCLDTGSVIDCYATDEPGKAEGFHPLDFGRKMGLFMSEAKTVPDEINIAMNKCTGYTHRIHASTPGLPIGHFHDNCRQATRRESLSSIEEVGPINYIEYVVTAYQCKAHLSNNYIEQMKRDLPGGENGAAFQSQVMAEFGTTDEMVVIPYHLVYNATKLEIPWIQEEVNKGGLDLSDGGDETVLVIRNGNKLTHIIPVRFDNTMDTVQFLHEKFIEHKLNTPTSYIFSDCGGLGKPILDRLVQMGWHNIRYVDNRNRASHNRTYANRGAEMWFEFCKLLEQKEVSLIKDEKLIKQLSTRYYKIRTDNTHLLLSKIEQKSKGYPSPDRADAVVLAFSDFKSQFKPEEVSKPFELPPIKEVQPVFSIKEWAGSTGQQGSWETVGKRMLPSRDLDLSTYKAEIRRHNERIKQLSEINSN